MVGGIGDERVDVHSNQIAFRIAEHLSADYKLLHAPAVVDSVEAKAMFLQQSSIADVFRLARQANVALVGIDGYPEYSTMLKNHMGRDSELNVLGSHIIGGDICYNFIDARGQICDVSWNTRVISVGLDDLKHIPIIVGVAHGAEKLEAIRVSLTAQLINVLVTDHVTAQSLLLESGR